MHCRSSPLLAALVAVAVLAIGVASASANRLEFSTNAIRWVWSSVKLSEFNNEAHCPVTMEGSLHSRTVVKTPGALIGYITRAAKGVCTQEIAWLLTAADTGVETLPWHLRYSSFSGTLPVITRVRLAIVGMKYRQLSFAGAMCLYGSTEAGPAFVDLGREAGGAVTSAVFDETQGIPSEGGITCERLGFLAGNGTMSVLGATTRVRITLI